MFNVYSYSGNFHLGSTLKWKGQFLCKEAKHFRSLQKINDPSACFVKKKTKNVLFQEYYALNILFISINKEFYELQCHSGI